MTTRLGAAHQDGVYLSAAGRHDTRRRVASATECSAVAGLQVLGGCSCSGTYDDAVAQCRPALQIDPHFLGHFIWSRPVQKRSLRGSDAFGRAGALPGGSARMLAEQAHARAVAGEHDHARRLLAELERRARREYVDSHGLALVRVGLGDREGAIEMLERAEHERFPWLVRLRVDPRWAPLHGERRFQDLMRRVGIPGV